MILKIGTGYDIHALKDGKNLVFGGVEIPCNKSFVAHSDGDVLIHAIIDAILGALALGDIGKFFPDTDQEFKNIKSTILLEKIVQILKEKNFKVSNLDSNIILQKPKLSPFILDIRKNLAKILEIDLENVSVKAKTNEKMDSVGKELAIEANCVVLLEKTETT